MWADAQRDGCPVKYRWRPLQKFRNSIPCTTWQYLADPATGVLCNNAGNTRERKIWMQSEYCMWRNSVSGQEPPKNVAAQKTAKRHCSNEAKTRNPLKFAGVPQIPEPISAASGLKFAILCGRVEEVLLFNKFLLGKEASPSIGNTLWCISTMFTHSAITSPEVNVFG